MNAKCLCRALPGRLAGAVLLAGACCCPAAAAEVPDKAGKPAIPLRGLPTLVAPAPVPASPMVTAPRVMTGGLANLVIDNVSWQPRPYRAGSPAQVSYRVRNLGGVAAPASTTRVQFGGTLAASQATPPLAAGASHPGSVTLKPSACDSTLTIRADGLNGIIEANETDNTWTGRLDCSPLGRPGIPFKAAPAPTAGRVLTMDPSLTSRPTGGSQGAAAGPAENCSPDLRMDRVVLDPPHPRAGQTYRIKMWALQFLPDTWDIPQSWIAVRTPGHTSAIDSKYIQFARDSTMLQPSHTWERLEYQGRELELHVRLDNLDTLTECREDNNEFTWRYTVHPADAAMADLAFSGYVTYDHHRLINQDANLSGLLTNLGNATAGLFWIDFDCDDDRTANTRKLHRLPVGLAIKPGEVVAFNTRISWATPGMKVCILTLDKADEVVESNEYNNEYIGVTLHVYSEAIVQ